MKKFEERMAQIQLRADALIRKRQKLRRGVLLSSISALLCLALFVAPFLPGREPSGEAPEIAFDMIGSANGSSGTSVSVEYSYRSASYSVNEKADAVAELLRQITVVYETTGATTGRADPASPTESPTDAPKVDGKEETDGILIKVTTANGSAHSYWMMDTELENTDTGAIYPMTVQQAQQLRQLLGIQEEKP